MALLLLFVCGIANFAMHKAVIESGHPLFAQFPWYLNMMGGRIGLFFEFLMLLGSMLLVSNGSLAWAWGYLAYSLINGLAGWLILSDRI